MCRKRQRRNMKITRWEGNGIPDAEALQATLAGEGLRARTWQDRPGSFYAEHRHRYDEIRWILAGRLTIAAGGEEYVLSPGDRVEIPAGTRHHLRVPSDAPVVYLVATRHARVLEPPVARDGE